MCGVGEAVDGNWPNDQDCGPGFGEIDHYRLLHPVASTGLKMPLCCENVFAPLMPRPTKPEGIDVLARRAREFLETVIAGLQTSPESLRGCEYSENHLYDGPPSPSNPRGFELPDGLGGPSYN